MKNLLLLVLIAFSMGTFAQNSKNCVTPLSNFMFQPLFGNLNAKKEENQKLNLAKKIALENCLSTEQVKKIAELFENDYNRLLFVQTAYTNTTDKDNFYEIYNSFTYFSTVFRLHDYVLEQRGGVKTVNEVVQPNVMTFPAYDYPDFRKYFGKVGCTNILNDADFNVLAEKVFKEPTEDKKLYAATAVTSYNCLQTAQAMKLASLLQIESNRLDFLKKAYNKLYDPDNFKYAVQLFTTENGKKEFNSITGGSSSVITNNPPCEVNQQEFNDLKNLINKQSFANVKLNVAKQSIQSKKCFKTNQIIDLLTLFSYSDSKMDIAKFAYDYTTDKENYVKIADSFTFSTDKENFLKFLKSKN